MRIKTREVLTRPDLPRKRGRLIVQQPNTTSHLTGKKRKEIGQGRSHQPRKVYTRTSAHSTDPLDKQTEGASKPLGPKAGLKR